MRSALLVAVACLALATLASCGGEEEIPPPTNPAAGEDTPPSGTPGVPEGAPYDVDGREWAELSGGEQITAAAAYVEDDPDRCGEPGEIDPEDVAAYTTTAYGADFPLDIPAADVLAEGCDAARQS